jgi:hypothetical protein
MPTIRPPDTTGKKLAFGLILACLAFQFFATKYHLEVPSYIGNVILAALAAFTPQVFGWVSDGYRRMPMHSSSGFDVHERDTDPQGVARIKSDPPAERPSTDPQTPDAKKGKT